MIYGKNGIFDVERLIDLLSAFENFKVASKDVKTTETMPLSNNLTTTQNTNVLVLPAFTENSTTNVLSNATQSTQLITIQLLNKQYYFRF